MARKNKVADVIYALLLTLNDTKVSQTAKKAMHAVRDEEVPQQILGIASLLLTLMDKYGLNYIDILGMAETMVYSGEYNNMLPEFKNIQTLMRDKYEIIEV